MRIDELIPADGSPRRPVSIMFEVAITVSCEAHCCAPSARPPTAFSPLSDDPDMPGATQCKNCKRQLSEHTSSLRCSAPIVTGGVEATFILGITDSDLVLVRNAADSDLAPWREHDMHLPIAIAAHGLKLATQRT